jgi:hypothetical protein
MRTSRLYNQLRDLFGQSIPFADQRHLQTLIWMVVGVICSECINKREMAGRLSAPVPAMPKVINAASVGGYTIPASMYNGNTQSADCSSPGRVGNFKHYID